MRQNYESGASCDRFCGWFGSPAKDKFGMNGRDAGVFLFLGVLKCFIGALDGNKIVYHLSDGMCAV